MSNILPIGEIYKELSNSVFENFDQLIIAGLEKNLAISNPEIDIKNLISNKFHNGLLKKIYEFEAGIVCIDMARKLSDQLKGKSKGYRYDNVLLKYNEKVIKSGEHFLKWEDFISNKDMVLQIIIEKTIKLFTFTIGEKKVIGSFAYAKSLGLIGNDVAESIKNCCQFDGSYTKEQYELEKNIITNAKNKIKQMEEAWNALKRENEIKILMKKTAGFSDVKYFTNTAENVNEALNIVNTKGVVTLSLSEIVNSINRLYIEKNYKTMNGQELYKKARKHVYNDFERNNKSLSVKEFKYLVDIFLVELSNKDKEFGFIYEYVENKIKNEEYKLNFFNLPNNIRDTIVKRENTENLLNGNICVSEKSKSVKEFIYKEEIYKQVFEGAGFKFKDTKELDCMMKNLPDKKQIKFILTGDKELLEKITCEIFIKELYYMYIQFAEENLKEVGELFLRNLCLKVLTSGKEMKVNKKKI